MEKAILDYSYYVEKTCTEKNAVFESYPSIADVERSAKRFIDTAEMPPDPFNVPYSYEKRAIELWSEFHRSRLIAFGKQQHLSHCPYCNSLISKVDVSSEHLSNSAFKAIVASKCINCGWWEFEEELPVEFSNSKNSYSANSIHRRAVLLEFSVAGSDVPINCLRKHITTNPNSIYSINPTRLEKLVASVFSDFMDCEAIHVGGPNDNGIDVILVKGERQYVIQVKRRSCDNATEAVSGIRDFLGAMVLKKSVKGIFVSTAKRFSKQATIAAQQAHDVGAVEYIQLVNAEKLIDVCKIAASKSTPPEIQYATASIQLTDHLRPGFETFLALFMGHPDWDYQKDSFFPNKKIA